MSLFYSFILCIWLCSPAKSVIRSLYTNESGEIVVEGSVVLLYCEVTSATPTVIVTWTKDGTPLVPDIPHIIMRNSTSSDGSTILFLLVVDPFQSSDNGAYQCTAEDVGNVSMGTSIMVTASALTSGSLQVTDVRSVGGVGITDERAVFESGDMGILQYTVGHVNDSTMNFLAPALTIWLRNGRSFNGTINTVPNSVPAGSVTTSIDLGTVDEFDVGLYQCAFFDFDRNETLYSRPLRLHSGVPTVEAVSPPIIVLRLPDKLAVELHVEGEYLFLLWRKVGDPGFNFPDESFGYFGDVYFVENTTMADLGRYGVAIFAGFFPNYARPPEIFFEVILHVDANTSVINYTAVVYEGGSVNISCISYGVPVPTVSWTLNNQTTPFRQSDQSTDFIFAEGNVTQGSVVSTLQIVNAQYPADDGTYECNGFNHQLATSVVIITVQVLVPPEVNLTTDRISVGGSGGDTATLTCSVRGNPMTYNYSWTHEGTLLPNETSAILANVDEVGIYSCEVRNEVGVGVDSILIKLSGVKSLPDVLFSQGHEEIVEGSVVWLYCQVDSLVPTLTLSWTKDGTTLVPDTPHIRIRNFASEVDSTTLLLEVDTFQDSDNGIYMCTAENRGDVTNGTELNLTVSASVSGSLQFDSLMTQVILGGTIQLPPSIVPRAAASSGDMVILEYSVNHVDEDVIYFTIPTVMWLRNGMPVLGIMPTNFPHRAPNLVTTGGVTTRISIMFGESDADVYQCIFTDTVRREVFLPTPIRVDTGEILTLEAVSPSIIILRPPDELVVVTHSTGRYFLIEWSKDGNPLGSPVFNPPAQSFIHFREVYFVRNTSMDDLGRYGVNLFPYFGSAQLPPSQIFFDVILYVGANTSVISDADVIVYEGDSVNISCITRGVPVPNISWTINNQTTSFNQTDQTTDFIISGGDVTQGSVVSTIQIFDVQYPTDEGIYMCIGSNSPTALSSGTIAMQVLVRPEVTITTDHPRVGGNIAANLTCAVTRSNPMTYTLLWTHNGTVLTNETSAILTNVNQAGIYRCEVTNEAGIGVDSISITMGVVSNLIAYANPSGPVIEGSFVVLSCLATGNWDIPISYTWTNPHGQVVSHFELSVTINTIGDYGNYTCTASNIYGSRSVVYAIEEPGMIDN